MRQRFRNSLQPSPASLAGSAIAKSSSIRVIAFTRGTATVRPAASAGRTSGSVSHSLRKGSVSRTVRAATNDGNATSLPTIALPPAMRDAESSESRRASTWRRSESFASRNAVPCGAASARGRSVRHRAMVTHRFREASPAGPYNAAFARSPSHEERLPDPSRAPQGAACANARPGGRRPGDRADGAGSMRATAIRFIRTGSTAISITCPASRSRKRSSCSWPARTATGTCSSAATRTRSAKSGTASATVPTPRARSSASTRRTRSPSSTRCSRISPRTSRRSTRRSASSRAWDRKVTDLLNEVRSRARTGVAAPEEIVDVRAAARRDAPRQGRARARS